MRIATWFVSTVLATSIFAGQVKAPDEPCNGQADPYHMTFVRSAFESFKDSEKRGGGLSSLQIKYFTNNDPSLTQLGDSTSIAVLKLYNLDELVKTENMRPYLPIISLSFSDSHNVFNETDRSPRVTTVVLDYLQQKVYDQEILRIVAKLKACTSTCSCPRTPPYF
jgi:hypothetical protein